MKLKYIIFHCSDSAFGDVDLIRDWHINGNGWRDIGYNAVITNGRTKTSKVYNSAWDGRLQIGRGLNLDNIVSKDETGAHTKGIGNRAGLGICLIGKDNFTVEQFKTALCLAKMYLTVDPKIEIKGHNEMGSPKSCPNFSMDKFRSLLADENGYNEFMIRNELSDYIKDIIEVK